ncbi:MAG: DNA repair protein RadC [Clostridia bacterium]|nr:DNA repair protein RadC [Clostridia bacterium]
MDAYGHEGHRQRLRERFMRGGLAPFAAHEALELLLCYALPRKNTNPLAHALIDHFGSLDAVLEAPPERMMEVPGIGESAAALIALVLPLARMADRARVGERPLMTNIAEAKAYCCRLFDGSPDEALYVICLDAQHRVLRAIRALTGTIDEIAIYPRVILNIALTHKAHSIVLAHNHPSGVKEPSEADLQVTNHLKETLGAVGVPLFDHFVCAGKECFSIGQWQNASQPFHTERAPAPKAADAKTPRPASIP